MSSATHRIATLLVRARALDERVEERARAGLPCDRDAQEASAIRWAVDRLRPRFAEAATRADERAQEILARRTRPRLDFLASLCDLLHLERGSAPPAVLDAVREVVAFVDALRGIVDPEGAIGLGLEEIVEDLERAWGQAIAEAARAEGGFRRTRPRLDFLASLCELLHLEPGSAPPAVLDRLRELIAERDALAAGREIERSGLAAFVRSMNAEGIDNPSETG